MKKSCNKKFEIIQLTTVHPRDDTRIFIKETQTLAAHLPHRVLLMVADGKENTEDVQEIVSVHDLGNLGGGRFDRILRGSLQAFFAICKIKPAIVHFHDPELIPLGLSLKVIGYKVIYDVHEDVPRQIYSKHYLPLMIRKPLARIISTVEWFAAKVFDAIISATPKIAERFPAAKTITIQNFPIINELLQLLPTPYPERPYAFAYPGVVSTIRGIGEIIRAFEHLNDIYNARFELAGEFSPYGLKDTLRMLPGWRFVNYHGLVSRLQLSSILSCVRAGLVLHHPVPNEIDAQPIKLFEYMSASLPVIASDFPVWRRIIDDAGCGLLVDPMKPEKIAEAMRWILEHPTDAEEMGKRGRQAVEKTYNWDAEAMKLLSLYKKLLNS
jgi:glycosyltransferase involved in cell wall biosynthesis